MTRSKGPVRSLVAACLSLACAFAAGQFTAKTFMMRHANPARTGQVSQIGALQGQLAWQYRTGGIVQGMAVDPYGHIFLGATFNEDYWNNEVYATSLNPNGTVRWRQRVVPYVWGASQGVRSWPTFDPHFKTFTMNSTNGELLQFSADGDPIMTIPRNSNATNDSSPNVMLDGSILHYQIGSLMKFTRGGGLIWTASLFSQTTSAVNAVGDVVMGGVRTTEPHGSTDITYLNADGTLRWRRTSSRGLNAQPIFGPDGTVYMGDGAFNPDGTVKWGSPGGGNNSLGQDGRLFRSVGRALNARDSQSGALLWSSPIPSAGNMITDLAIDGRGFVYATTSDGYLYAFEPVNGQIVLSGRFADVFYTGPILGLEGAVIASGRLGGTYEYYVFCIR